jgi:predicted transcriptional regulator of viral defense system
VESLALHRFSAASFDVGIEVDEVDDIPLRVYSPEKTIADCCKFRYQLGMDVFLEALALYQQQYRANFALILEYAQICRVGTAIKPCEFRFADVKSIDRLNICKFH